MERNFPEAAGANQSAGSLSGGGRDAPGSRRSDGGTFGHAGGGSFGARPRFDAPVPQNGYRWWYVDALSDDGQHGLTIIGFVGSVFSPYYFKSRQNGLSDPENFCSINVALYGPIRRWAMTERSKRFVSRNETVFEVGPSSMRWQGNKLIITIDERCVPLPLKVQGTVTLNCEYLYNVPVPLGDNSTHFWQAVAPQARVDVDFSTPLLKWQGNAYHDMNWGDEALEDGFQNWTWQRVLTPEGTVVFYDAKRLQGTRQSFAMQFAAGKTKSIEPPMMHRMKNTFWGVRRDVVSGLKPVLLSTLEDAPFYTRNHLRVTHQGASCDAIQESLSLLRFKKPWVQKMLPYRMLRKA